MATLAELRRYLQGGPTALPVGDDDLLQEALDASLAWVQAQTQQAFSASADSTRKFDALADVHGGTLSFTPYFIAAITSVVNGDGATIPSTAYVTEPRNVGPFYAITLLPSSGTAWLTSTSGDSANAIAVTGKWAYSAAAPSDIDQATIRLAGWLYRQRSTSADMDRPMMSPEGVMLLPGRIPNDVYALIAPYKARI